jgi:tripartite-type tricarboxylate transporter receptor subunit TctC
MSIGTQSGGKADPGFRFAPSGLLALQILVAMTVAIPAHAADYYAGKTIELIVGADVGGGYDIYARTVARHLADHIPGHPTILVKNMLGAGSVRAAAYLSTTAPKDGTSIAAIMPGAIMDPLLEGHESLFDPTKVQFVGTANSGIRVCATLDPSKTKTFDEALAQKTVIGASHSNDSTRDYPFMLKHTTGVKFDIVAGYKGTTDISLAMERGEVEGICGWDWSSLKSQKAGWLSDKKANIILQVGLDTDAELDGMGVPSVWKYVKDEDSKKIIEFIVSQQVFLRSYIAPPGTPDAELAILRSAFDATMTDKAFLADADRARLAISPLPGAKVQEMVHKLYASPKEIVARARAAIKP